MQRMKTPKTLLGGLSAREFLRDYWQKKPLLIRGAMPDFSGLLSPKELIALACGEDVQARIVTRRQGKYELLHSPFSAKDFRGRDRTDWTVLVQSVNHHLRSAEDLLKAFSFIPHARLDDLMISYAPRGGGVGPHFDSYDVFLLQGMGHRRWQISTQEDRTLIEDAPLRILKKFRPEQEWVLAPGDMLYLPPHCAHNGIAEDDCMTYSIGFRTPAYQELLEQFLIYLQDRICVDGMYSDPDLKPQKHPSEIGQAMLKQVTSAIRQVRWDKEDVANFLGCYLSEPKAHVYFDPPERPLTLRKFISLLKTRGVVLDMKSQLLCNDNTVFMNGEPTPVSQEDYVVLRSLADRRELPALESCPPGLAEMLHRWYEDGYLSPVTKAD